MIHTRPTFSPSLFFFNYTATTEIYTLSLHDALPIYPGNLCDPSGRKYGPGPSLPRPGRGAAGALPGEHRRDRKSTRLNSSHVSISYAVFCLKKKKKKKHN